MGKQNRTGHLFRHDRPPMDGWSPYIFSRYFQCPSLSLPPGVACNPTLPLRYVWETILPAGSVPGTWGMTEMDLVDLVGNVALYDFTEVLRFDIQ